MNKNKHMLRIYRERVTVSRGGAKVFSKVHKRAER